MSDSSPQMIKLISAEGHEFIVDRRCACVSKTIEAMLEGSFAESKGEIRFPELSTPILEKVLQYFYYKVRYANGKQKAPEFQIPPEMAVELLMAANFLDA